MVFGRAFHCMCARGWKGDTCDESKPKLLFEQKIKK